MRQGELPQNLPALKAATPKLATPANLIDVCEQIDNAAQVSFYSFFFFLPVWHLIQWVPFKLKGASLNAMLE